jgi:hypothetical protein
VIDMDDLARAMAQLLTIADDHEVIDIADACNAHAAAAGPGAARFWRGLAEAAGDHLALRRVDPLAAAPDSEAELPPL